MAKNSVTGLFNLNSSQITVNAHQFAKQSYRPEPLKDELRYL